MISVFHLDSVDAAAEKLETEKIEEKENAVKVSAEHFSVFAVSLVEKENSWKELAYLSDTIAVELGELITIHELLHSYVLRCRVIPETNPTVIGIKHDADGQLAIEALHEGTAKLLVTQKWGRGGANKRI